MPSQLTLFRDGVNAAIEDESRQALQPGVVVQTSGLSPWLYLNCVSCRHTFRAGDRVELGQAGVQHENAPQGCPDALITDEDAAASAEFFEGLHAGWPPPADQPVRRLAARSPHVNRPRGDFKRRTCPVCAHTFRVGDEVLICPCSPLAPMCDTAIHRDPVHHLSCWELWNPGSRLTHCPITLRSLA